MTDSDGGCQPQGRERALDNAGASEVGCSFVPDVSRQDPMPASARPSVRPGKTDEHPAVLATARKPAGKNVDPSLPRETAQPSDASRWRETDRAADMKPLRTSSGSGSHGLDAKTPDTTMADVARPDTRCPDRPGHCAGEQPRASIRCAARKTQAPAPARQGKGACVQNRQRSHGITAHSRL